MKQGPTTKAEDVANSLGDWIGFRGIPDWTKSRLLGGLIGVLLTLTILALIPLAIWAAFQMLLGASGGTAEPASGGLGAGALIVTILGAPFVVWRAIVAQQTVNLQKEGLMTDRIAKAVEQLGAEKRLDRIGRPVKVLFGHSRQVTRLIDDVNKHELGPTAIELSRYVDTSFVGETGEPEQFHGWHVVEKTWSSEKTVIEWQGKPLLTSTEEHIKSSGEWQVFSETIPNIEVRTGGIYALERIAQDSIKYDMGRDYISVIEILCAYVRENTPSGQAVRSPHQVLRSLIQDNEDGPGLSAEDAFNHPSYKYVNRYGWNPTELDAKNLRRWSEGLPALRNDLQVALIVLGRRGAEGISLEKRRAFRANLRESNLQNCQLSGNFESSDFDNSALDGARLSGNFQNVSFAHTTLQYATCEPMTNFESSDFVCANLNGAFLVDANLARCKFSVAQMEGTFLFGANLQKCLMDPVKLKGVHVDSSTDLSGSILLGVDMSELKELDNGPSDELWIDKSVKNPESLFPERYARIDSKDHQGSYILVDWRNWRLSQDERL